MIYKITISFDDLTLVIDGKPTPCGFIKNEYIWAKNENIAVEKAKGRIKKKLLSNQAVKNFDPNCDFYIDEIERTLSFWILLKNEGFIFYRKERNGVAS